MDPLPGAGRTPDARARDLLLLAALNVVVWGWSLRNGFVFDDLQNVVENRWIRDWAALPQAFLHHAAGFDAGYSTSFYRPMMHVLYAIANAVAGPRAWAFHLLNVTLHVLAVAGAYQLTRAIVARWGDPGRHRWLPLVAAVIFSVHPVHTEPVLWVAGITDVSYTAFGLFALIAYLGAFERPRLAMVAGLLVFVALLCKETAAVLLLLMVLFEGIERHATRSRTSAGAWAARAALIRLAPALVAAAVYLALRLAALGSLAPSAAQHPRGPAEIVADGLALFARYLAVLLAPVQLTVMRSIHLDTGFADPLAFVGLAAAAMLVALAVRYWRSPVIVLALAFVVIPILPVLYTPAIESGQSVFGERYLYLPVLGLGLLIGLLLEDVRSRFVWGRAATTAVVIAFVAWSAVTALARTRAWSTSLTLWTDAVEKAPDSAAAHEGLCFALYEAGRFTDAFDACARALAIEPGRVDARSNLATTLLALGRPADAKREFDAVLAVRPNSAQALVNRGLACMMLGQPTEAMASYRQALAVDPGFAEAYNVIGVALARAGRPEEALGYLEQAVRLDPGNAEYRANLGALRTPAQ